MSEFYRPYVYMLYIMGRIHVGCLAYSKIPWYIEFSKEKCISLILSAEGLGNSTETLQGHDIKNATRMISNI
jgi:hypothetical protein